MEILIVSTGVVALAEIGDKTQLLAFILAARFKKPLPIIAGILAATLVNGNPPINNCRQKWS
jgi:putative Ca2+/H+ antiporter (TMEM165/GDT1 family)